jgi:hypothetical protein
MSCDGQYVTCPQTQNADCYFNGYPFTPYIIPDGYITRTIPQDPITTVDDNYDTVVIPQPDLVVTEYGIDNYKAISTIKANLNINLTDTRESPTANVLRFKVKNCKWTFDSVIR